MFCVDGVLMATTQPAKPSVRHVKLVENVNKFLEFLGSG